MSEVSVAVKVIRLAPSTKVVGALFATVTVLSTLSLTITEARKLTTAASLAGDPETFKAATVIGCGAVSTGAVWSATVTVVLAVCVLSAESVALNSTTVAPSGNSAGALLVRVIAASTLSTTDAVARSATRVASVAAVPVASTAAITVFAGAVTTGAV